jgi:hypothetical protein
MPHARAIQTPVTRKVRDFLVQQQAELPPWSGLEETYDSLYSVMRERRRDPAFWHPLEALLRDIVADRSLWRNSALQMSRAELLEKADIDDLVSEMRRAIGVHDETPRISAVGRFCARLSRSALAGFMLLGVALSGCYDATGDPLGAADASLDERNADTSGEIGTGGAIDTDDTSSKEVETDADTQDNGACTGEGYTEACDAGVDEVFADAVASSCLVDYQRGSVCDCYGSLNGSWREGLTQLFENGDAEQIEAALRELAQCCEWGGEALTQTYTDATEEDLLASNLCQEPVLIYMAVPFFDKK